MWSGERLLYPYQGGTLLISRTEHTSRYNRRQVCKCRAHPFTVGGIGVVEMRHLGVDDVLRDAVTTSSLRSGKVEAIEIHHLVPCHQKVTRKRLQ